MQTTPRPPRHVHISRRAFIGIAVAAFLVIAALVTALILISGANQTPWPNRATVIPGAQLPNLQTPHAMRYDLRTAEAAEAYFQRLLNSPFIGLRGDAPVPAEHTDDGWTMREENGDGTALTAAFDDQGVIASLSVTTNLGGAMKNSHPWYALSNGDESLFSYIRAFAYEYLPDVTIDSGEIVADRYNDEGRFLTVQTDNQLARSACEFVVQVDPEARIVGFRLLVDKELAYIRTSRMAEAEGAETAAGTAPQTGDDAAMIARDALAKAYGLPEDEVAAYILVDVTLYQAGDPNRYKFVDPDTAYWLVNFRMPQTDEAFYSDYGVMIDGATGEILQIFDPSNNSNG